ncbi:MAG: PorT family protein [Bacteroidales bacterium]|jgi:hypothetical protein|nr:PorT family protein [Bacteroidales bacterium]
MKKILITISLSVFCILFSTAIFAQESKTEFGIKAGINLMDDNIFSNIYPGIHAGVFAEYTFNNFVGIQSELLYSMLGSKSSIFSGYGDGSEIIKSTYKTGYIVLPVLAKLYVVKKLSIDLGPQFGYIISSRYKTKITNEELLNELRNDGIIIGDRNDYDEIDDKFNVSFAAGLSYKIGNRFSVSGRYNLALTKFHMNGFGFKENAVQFSIGYRLK